MKEPAHVFVCYSTLSFDAACRIAASVQAGHEARCYFFILFETDQGKIPQGSTVFQMSPPPQSYSEWSKPFAIARWFSSSLKELDADGVTRLIAYLPHPFELPGNHFLFFEERAKRVELLPDGLINYYNRSLRPESFGKALRYGVRVALRLLASGFYGLGYKPYSKGHITQYERGLYSRSWTSNEGGYLTRGDVVQVLPPRGQPASSSPKKPQEEEGVLDSPHPRTLLLLDQEIHHIVDSSLEEQLRATLVREALKLKAQRILYKSHPRGKNRASELRRAGLEIEDKTGSELAEDLIFQEGVSILLGFYSTPLVLSKDEVASRISVFPGSRAKGLIRPNLVKEIRIALIASGARLVEAHEAQ